MAAGHEEDPRLVEEVPDLESVGRERQPRRDDVDAVLEQRRARLPPVEVQRADVRIRMGLPERPHGGRDQQRRHVPDDDPGRSARLAGRGGRGPGRAQRLTGAREERRPGLGEVGPSGVAGEQPGADLILQPTDLAAERRLREMEALGRTPEVQVLGDHGERVHEPEVEVVHDVQPRSLGRGDAGPA